MERSVVSRWAATFAPRAILRYNLRWKFVNDRGAAGGRAAVHVVPPDSLRFDYRGPFGRSGAAVVVGDSGIWGEPEGDVRGVVRVAPLFWAALGAPLPPSTRATLLGYEDQQGRAWRSIADRDTFDVVVSTGPPTRIRSQLRRAGQLVGATDVVLDSAQRARQGRIDLFLDETRFSFTVAGIDSLKAVDPTTWKRP